MICTKAIDTDQLVARLDDIKSRTKSSIDLSRRLIDHSFLRFRATHRLLYAAQRSQELLNALPKIQGSATVCRELSDNPARTTKESPGALHSGMSAASITCDHCEGILLNNKAYRVQTEDCGVILLDMIVCYACSLEAQNLGLEIDELEDLKAEAEPAWRSQQALDSTCSI